MSAQEFEMMLRFMPPAELRRFAEWWEIHRHELLKTPAQPGEETDSPSPPPTAKAELRQECIDHPEKFVRLDDGDMDKLFKEIENEAMTSLTHPEKPS